LAIELNQMAESSRQRRLTEELFGASFQSSALVEQL